jgi:hypothetical protein
MDMALYKDSGDVWVESDCKQHGGKFKSLLTKDPGGLGDSQSVQINDAMEDVVVVLA